TTGGGGFAGLQASATDLLEKVNTIPFKQIGDNLDGILRAGNDLANGAQMRQSLTEVSATIASTKDLVAHLDSSITPAMRQLPSVVAGLQTTMTNLNKLVLSVDNGYGNNTKFSRDLDRLMAQLNDA